MVLDLTWIDLVHSKTSNVKPSGEELLMSNVNTRNNGEYGCKAQNGVEPSLWVKFELHVSGMIKLMIENF